MCRLVFFLLLLISCGASAPKPSAVEQSAVAAPKFRTAKIKNTYPHDAAAYTQGLLFAEGKLYESTGEYGSSSLRRVDLGSGKVEKIEALADRYFGEGLALDHDGKLFQLTWREGKAFVYDRVTFRKTATYDVAGEGWGIVAHGGELFVSDGTSTIRVIDPNGFQLKRTIEVRTDRGALDQLNELEWIEGKIWANIYFSPLVAVIDPATGVVVELIDCTALVKNIENPTADVLNGIAYDSVKKEVFLTGKRWEKLFEIEL